MTPCRFKLAAALFAFAAPALAEETPPGQLTVAQLLEAGGRRLDGPAFKAAFAGRWTAGYNLIGAEIKSTFTEDGRYKGTSYNLIGGTPWARGKVLAFYGTWKVNDAGQVCYDIKFSPGTGHRDECVYAFELKGEYFMAPDDEASTLVFVRKPHKPLPWE